eukprot:514686_1
MSKEETFDSVKKRHSNFHHFSRLLKEAVEVFGTEYQKGIVERIYHGINQEVIFCGVYAKIFGPLSTTCNWQVAIQFSDNLGMIAELVPSMSLKYFNCEWISPYPYEHELLFIGGFADMNFVSITKVDSGAEFKLYITAFRMIEYMISAQWFIKDPADIHKILKQETLFVESLELQDVSLFHRKLCLALVHHELHRYKPNDYKELPQIHKYVDDMLHQICISKQEIQINWESMNTNLSKRCNSEDWGYIGYKFMREMFCHQQYEGVDLEVFSTLFPNLELVKVYKLSKIDSRFLDDIIDFLGLENNSKVYYFELRIAKKFDFSNILEICSAYEEKFKNIGYDMFIDENNFYDTQAILIIKLRSQAIVGIIRLFTLLSALLSVIHFAL